MSMVISGDTTEQSIQPVAPVTVLIHEATFLNDAGVHTIDALGPFDSILISNVTTANLVGGANVMPPPNSHGIAIFPNRKEAIAAASLLETPDEARERIKAGGPKPEHYIPTPPLDESGITERADDLFNPYKKVGKTD